MLLKGKKVKDAGRRPAVRKASQKSRPREHRRTRTARRMPALQVREKRRQLLDVRGDFF